MLCGPTAYVCVASSIMLRPPIPACPGKPPPSTVAGAASHPLDPGTKGLCVYVEGGSEILPASACRSLKEEWKMAKISDNHLRKITRR